MSNFFRGDLNLGKKWWHRLLVVIFLLAFWFRLSNLLIDSNIFDFSTRTYQKVENLSSRITTKLKSKDELTKPWEIFNKWETFSRYNVISKETKDYYDQLNLYCSTELYKHIDELMQRAKIYNFCIYGSNCANGGISVEIVKEYVKNNNIYCMHTDLYEQFPLILVPDKKYQEIYWFYKITFSSRLSGMRNILRQIWIFTIIFSIIIIIYYKIILYIIYGNPKNKKKKKHPLS